MAINQQIQDPSTKGVEGLDGLKSLNQLKEQGILSKTPRISSLNDYNVVARQALREAVPQEVGFVGINDSRFDKQITSITQLDNLDNTRGELQPWYEQIGAGVAKGAVLAGTTLADGIVGSVVGLATVASTGDWSSFWDNPFSTAMQGINEWSEKALVNYYTDAETNNPWYENIFTANFIGDKFLKNLGFAVGAAYSGRGYTAVLGKAMKLNKARQAFKGATTASGEALTPTAALQAYRKGETMLDGVKLTAELAKDAKKLKNADPILKLTGAVTGAFGEARIEAIQNSKDWFELHKQQLDDARDEVAAQEREALIRENPRYVTYSLDTESGEVQQNLTPEAEAILDARVRAKFDYEGGLQKLAEDRAKVGNADFLMNLPLLTVSDAWQFGKFYAGGYNTAKKGSNILRTVSKEGTVSYSAAKPSHFRNAMKIVGKGVAEGPYEEMGQAVAAKASGSKYASELNDFYGAKIDPEAEAETLGWLQSVMEAAKDTYGNAEGWEEGFIGGLTGIVGIPGFRSARKRGGGVQSPIYFQGGAREDIKEIRDRNRKDDAIVNQLNERVQSPEFLNYYQSAIRHNKYQREMDEAVDNSDNFSYKNAEHNQFISDIIMFEKAGRINDLYDIIEEAGTIKPEDVEGIRGLTTNMETGTSVYDNMTDEEVIAQIKKQTQEAKENVERYRKISNDLKVKIGDNFDEDGLEEMTYYFSNIDNIEKRFKELHNTIKDQLIEVSTGLDITIEEDGETITVGDLLNLSPVELINKFADSKKLQTLSAFASSISASPSKKDILDNLVDLGKLAERRMDFIDKYDAYLKNPQALRKKQDDQKEKVLKGEEKEKADNLKSKILNAKTLLEFGSILGEESDLTKKQELLDELEKEGNKMATDYKEVQMYNSAVAKSIDNQEISPEAKATANDLLRQQFSNANTLEDIANPNSIYINDPESVYDENLSAEDNEKLFAEAQYGLLSAMREVNNGEKFKSRFPKDYLLPVEKTDGSKGTVSKDATGDSQTSTVPPINNGEVSTFEPARGNITSKELEEENTNINDAVPTPKTLDDKQKGKRKYYRPTIPQLHIEASKKGDFRPFNVVVKENEGKNFDELYNYLKDNGAFSYVNEGNLKAGDELGFMVDPDFNDHTIFIVDRRNNQIVGSLDESDYVVDRYEGLKQLTEKIKEEYTQSPKTEGKPQRFIATPTTKVSQMMVGKIPYSRDERGLSNIPKVSGESVFGIIKNGVLSTNGKLRDNEVIKPVDMSQKEGRMYLLIPNAAGTHSPAAVRVKHFNRTEYNPDDVVVQSYPLFKNIQSGIDAIANSQNEEDLSNGVKELARHLYTGELHIDFVSGKRGNAIRFTKVQKDASGNEIYAEVDGKRIRREVVKNVYLTEKWDPNMEFQYGDNGLQTQPDSRSIDSIKKEIQEILLEFNLPLQVNLGMLNKGGYNNMLLSSGILTSNLTEASVIGSWFTTDYFDIQGNLQQALSLPSVKPQDGKKIETPVGGKEGAIPGTPVTVGSDTYYVDLTNQNIRNGNGVLLTSYPPVVTDLAYIQGYYGSAQNGHSMIGGVALLPNGKVIDRNTGQYLTGKEADDFKNKLTKKEKGKVDSKKVISKIAENQKKVDRERTDGNFYYILEEDGKYHEYDRVHKRLGSNWIESQKQTDALQTLKVNLSKNVDNVNQFNQYLKNLSSYYKIDLSAFEGKTDVKSRETIVNIVRDKMAGTNSQRALDAGTAIDSVIRSFFTSKDIPVKPDNMSEQAFSDLITSLTEIKSNIEASGETFLTNNVILFHKYQDGSRVAGEVDILAVDANGNFKIYDVKTSKYSFYTFTDRFNNKVNYFKNKSNMQRMSQEQYYTNQLSAYKNLFESQYNTPIATLAILPFVLSYNGDIVSNVEKEKGILITYNPGVNVPLDGKVATPVPVQNTTVNSSLPIFNSTFETQNPINNVLPEYSLNDSSVGYFIRDGKIHKGYLSPIGKVNGVEVFMTKVPKITKGFGSSQEHVGYVDFHVVFPNGNTLPIINGAAPSYDEKKAKETIKGKLEGNPERVIKMSMEKTILHTPETKPVKFESAPTPANLNKKESSGAASTIAKESAINKVDDEFEEEFELREATGTMYVVWNREKELEWLDKVLPQLSKEGRVKIVEGLIEVAERGTVAWGQFKDGMIILSDKAATGTTYHEAFHVVFQLLVPERTRENLFREARKLYGNLSDRELEEAMAEGFRTFVSSSNTVSPNLETRFNDAIDTLGDLMFASQEEASKAYKDYNKIYSREKSLFQYLKDFFVSLFYKVRFWNYYSPSLTALYHDINNGRYAVAESFIEAPTNKIMELNYETLSDNLKEKWSKEKWDEISQEEKEQAIRCAV